MGNLNLSSLLSFCPVSFSRSITKDQVGLVKIGVKMTLSFDKKSTRLKANMNNRSSRLHGVTSAAGPVNRSDSLTFEPWGRARWGS